MQARPSTRLILFLLALKRNLAEKRISIDEFLSEIKSTHPRVISRMDFLQIVQRTIGDETNFEAGSLFSEMTHKGDVLSKDNFKKWFIRMPTITIHKIPTSQSIQRVKAPEPASSLDVRKEFLKIGMVALMNYINSKDRNPTQIFDDCDLDRSGDIDRIEFNKFLFACGLPEFKSRDNCRYMIDHVFDDYASQKMSKEEFFTIFKVKPVRKSLKRDPTEPKGKFAMLEPSRNLQKSTVVVRSQGPSPLLDKKVFASNKNSIVLRMSKDANPENRVFAAYEPVIVQGKQNFATRILPPPPPQFDLTPQSQAHPTAPKKHDIPNHPAPKPSNSSGKYPYSQHTFRLGDPSPQMAPYAEELQRLLASGRTFDDNKNPECRKGAYNHASDLFDGPAQLIQMSNEDMNRQRDKLTIDKYIEASDINQGQVGDCYFLCGLAAIVNKYPELISDLFFFDTNHANYYTVKYFIDGQWKIIKTDDQFPTRGHQFVMTKPKSNELWAMLLQKCFAKIYGSYEAINGGNTTEAFLTLTGAPYIYLNNNPNKKKGKTQDLKALIQEYDELGYVMATAGGRGMHQMGDTRLQEVGLVKGHGYSILGIYEICGETVIKLRNPWGHFEWKGQWGYNDSRWTPELLDKYDPQGSADDGVFFMGWVHFWKLFGEIQVCKVNPTFVHTTLRLISNKRKSNYIQMTVTKAGKYHIFICQQSARKHGGQRYQLSTSRVILMKKNDDGHMTFVGANCNFNQQIASVEAQLQRGTYIISAKIAWSNGWNEHESFLNAYGVDKVTFEKANRSIAPQFKEDLIDSYSTINDGKGTIKNFAREGVREAFSETYLSMDEGLAYTKITNNSYSAHLEIQMRFDMQGMKIIKPKENPYTFSVGPNEYEVLGFFIYESNVNYTVQERFRSL